MKNAVLQWGVGVIYDTIDRVRPRVYSEPADYIQKIATKYLLDKGLRPTLVMVSPQYILTVEWNNHIWSERLGK